MQFKNLACLILFFISIIGMDTPLEAQTVNSIYSMYGIGLTVDNHYGVNRALGGTGIAFQSGKSINISLMAMPILILCP